MRVKVHPHRTMVQSGVEACVSVTPVKKHGRAYYMGTVMLRDVDFVIHNSGVKRAQAEQVRNVHAWAVGEVIHELPNQYQPEPVVLRKMVKVTYHYNLGRFFETFGTRNGIACLGRDVTDEHFNAAYFCGRDFYVSKEW